MIAGGPEGGTDAPELELELRGVSRQFGAVRALSDVSFDCRAGEVHAIVGENGSGKSTLLGIASGFVDPDRGTVTIGGRRLRRDSPAEARKLGLAMAYQDTSLILAQPVKNNLYLSAPPDQRPRFWRRKSWARRVLADFELDIELFPDAPAGMLTLADRQLFEVAKALVTDPKVLLLDEPTTALGPHEVEALHRTLAACRDRGVGVVYVSHRLPEVLEIADRITVLRDGRSQGTFDARATTERELVDLIVGRAFEAAFPQTGPDDRRAPRRAGGRRAAGTVVRAGQFHARARRGRRHRRCGGQRSAPALRLPRRPAAPARREGRLRREGADARLDARGSALRDPDAPRRPQAGGTDARARGPGERHDPIAEAVRRARDSCADGRSERPSGTSSTVSRSARRRSSSPSGSCREATSRRSRSRARSCATLP